MSMRPGARGTAGGGPAPIPGDPDAIVLENPTGTDLEPTDPALLAGRLDPFQRPQVHDFRTGPTQRGAVYRLGAWGMDGDPSNVTSEGFVTYGPNALGHGPSASEGGMGFYTPNSCGFLQAIPGVNGGNPFYTFGVEDGGPAAPFGLDGMALNDNLDAPIARVQRTNRHATFNRLHIDPTPTFDVDVYADATTGNDANDGTLAAPVQTLARALQLLPVAWQHRCRVHLAAGTYDLPSIAQVGSPVGIAEPLLVDGAFVASGLGTRTVTGISGAGPNTVLTDAAMPAQPADAWAGWFLRWTSGPRSGQRWIIAQSTAQTFSLLNQAWPGGTVPAPGDTFVIERPGAMLLTPLGDEVHNPFGIGAESNANICWRGCTFQVRCDYHVMSKWCFESCSITGHATSTDSFYCAAWHGGAFVFAPLRSIYPDLFSDLPDLDSWSCGCFVNGLGMPHTVCLVAFQAGSLWAYGMVSRGYSNIQASSGSMWIWSCDLYSLGVGTAIGVSGRGLASIGGGRIATPPGIECTDVVDATAYLYHVDFSSGLTAAYVALGGLCSARYCSSPSGPLAAYGFQLGVLGQLLTQFCTVTGASGDVLVGKWAGTYASNEVNGVSYLDGSQWSQYTPTLCSPGPYLSGATANFMSFVGQVAVGSGGFTILNNLVRLGSIVRATIQNGQAGIYIMQVVCGPGQVKVFLNAAALGTPVDVLCDLVER